LGAAAGARSLVGAEIREACAALGLEVDALEIRRTADIVPAFEALKRGAEALYVAPDALVITNQIRINTLALGARLPTMHGLREYVEAGGPDVLWSKLPRLVPARGRIRRQDLAWSQAGRFAR